MPGKRSLIRASTPGSVRSEVSAGSHRTVASMAVWEVHRFGPRSARIRSISIVVFLLSSARRGGHRQVRRGAAVVSPIGFAIGVERVESRARHLGGNAEGNGAG